MEKIFGELKGHQMASVVLSLALLASTTWEAVAITPQHEGDRFLGASRANASIEADLDVLTRTAERGTISMAVESIMDTIEDSEMGSDLSVLQLSAVGSSASRRNEPATLEEYCTPQPADDDPDEGDHIMADWKGYGTMYPGVVQDENRNDTYDIVYDDGWTETRVKEKRLKETEEGSEEEKKGKKAKPAGANDPACKLQKELKRIKQGITKLQDKLAKWSLGLRAQMSGQRPVASDSNAGSPAPALPDPGPEANAGNKADKLKKLKERLAAKDAEAKELRQKVAANKDRIRGLYAPAAAPANAPSPAKTVDDLIAEYEAKIVARDQEIKELKGTLQKQEQELASLGVITGSLDDIEDEVDKLADDVAKAEKKRKELSDAGQLDPELRVGIEGVTESMKALYTKMKELKELEKKARKQKELAEQKKQQAKLKAEAAAKEAAAAKVEAKAAEAKGSAAEAQAAAQKAAAAQADLEKADADIAAANAMAKAGDAKVLEAAGEVQRDLESVKKGAQKLDTGVHPHGDKWWRYRYEHSYIEALLMVIITLEMSFFGAVHEYFRHKAYHLAGDTAPSHLERISHETNGFLYRSWLEQTAMELMVCLNVFLTIWIASKTHLLDYLPLLMPSTDAYHHPNTGVEYKNCALDICVVLFFAIIFYYFLMLSVLRYSNQMTQVLAGLREAEESLASSPEVSPRAEGSYRRGGMRRMSIKELGAMSVDTLNTFSDFFIENVKNEMSSPERVEDYKVVQEALGANLDKFPFWRYLMLEIRATIPEILKFGMTIWVPVTLTFCVFMLLHRFLAMGYLRIMVFFSVCLLALFLVMCTYIYSVCKVAQSGQVLTYRPGSVHTRFPTEIIVMNVLQYTIYMLCYGFARMVCQKWMWELHFWPVLALTVVAILLASLFVFIIAPIIPEFSIVMGMPPHVDRNNIKQMELAAKLMKESKAKAHP